MSFLLVPYFESCRLFGKHWRTYGISQLMRADIFYMRYSKDSDSYKEDVERVMRQVSDNAQHYAMYSRELDLLLSALRTIYPQQQLHENEK